MKDGICKPRDWRVCYVEASLSTLSIPHSQPLVPTPYLCPESQSPVFASHWKPPQSESEKLHSWVLSLCIYCLSLISFAYVKNSTMLNRNTLSRVRKQTGGWTKPKESSSRQISYWGYQKPIDIQSVNTWGKGRLQPRAVRVIMSSVCGWFPVGSPPPEKMGDLHPECNHLCICNI